MKIYLKQLKLHKKLVEFTQCDSAGQALAWKAAQVGNVYFRQSNWVGTDIPQMLTVTVEAQP